MFKRTETRSNPKDRYPTTGVKELDFQSPNTYLNTAFQQTIFHYKKKSSENLEIAVKCNY